MAENTEIARSAYDAWNARDFDRFASLHADDAELVNVASGETLRGPEGALQYAHMWADAFPDGRISIDNIIEAGDQVVVEFTGRGTQTGALSGPAGEIPATGRGVTLQLCDVIRVSNGKIASVRSYSDTASLLAQLGVMPGAPAAATS